MIIGYHSKFTSDLEIIDRGTFNTAKEALCFFASRKKLPQEDFTNLYNIIIIQNE
jgi:hypothetical protein